MLQFAIDNGILNPYDIQVQIDMKKRQEYLEMHNHAIWYNENNDLWHTYLDDDSDRGYTLKRRKKEIDILDLVVKYYKDKEKDPDIATIFHMWNDERLSYNEVEPQTHNRYSNDFKRYFGEKSLLYNMKMSQVDGCLLTEFIKKTIFEFNLSAKSYSNLRIIIRGMFKYGMSKKYTTLSMTSFFGDLELSKNIFKRRVVNKEKEVFNEDEILKITSHLQHSRSMKDLGILLAFDTGLRVGELSTLKKADFTRIKSSLHVRRTEITYKDSVTGERVVEVREFPKTEAGDRYLLLPATASDTIERILKLAERNIENVENEYLFCFDGKRIQANAFNRRITRICDKLDIPRRSMHKVRKTYGTTLFNNNVDESLIALQMGHSDINVTKKYYYFSNRNDAANLKQINNALKSTRIGKEPVVYTKCTRVHTKLRPVKVARTA